MGKAPLLGDGFLWSCAKQEPREAPPRLGPVSKVSSRAINPMGATSSLARPHVTAAVTP